MALKLEVKSLLDSKTMVLSGALNHLQNALQAMASGTTDNAPGGWMEFVLDDRWHFERMLSSFTIHALPDDFSEEVAARLLGHQVTGSEMQCAICGRQDAQLEIADNCWMACLVEPGTDKSPFEAVCSSCSESAGIDPLDKVRLWDHCPVEKAIIHDGPEVVREMYVVGDRGLRHRLLHHYLDGTLFAGAPACARQ